jgi:ribonuclease-3
MRQYALPVELNDQLLGECEETLEYRFQDRNLLVHALTHASIAKTRLESNERLEFLGDSILGTVVCEQLYRFYTEATEGELTRIKSVVVSRTTCAELTRRLGLDRFLLLGRGVDTQGRLPGSILAAVFESIVGAIYLDGGFDPARTFVLRHIAEPVQRAAGSETGVNFKSLLQQLAQRTLGDTPIYRVLDEQGPDHSKCFKVAAVVGSRSFASAWGPAKKEAEQRAAANAMAELQGEDLPYPPEET